MIVKFVLLNALFYFYNTRFHVLFMEFRNNFTRDDDVNDASWDMISAKKRTENNNKSIQLLMSSISRREC